MNSTPLLTIDRKKQGKSVDYRQEDHMTTTDPTIADTLACLW